MKYVTLKDAVHMIKIVSVYMNDESIKAIKIYISGLFDVDIDKIENMLR